MLECLSPLLFSICHLFPCSQSTEAFPGLPKQETDVSFSGLPLWFSTTCKPPFISFGKIPVSEKLSLSFLRPFSLLPPNSPRTSISIMSKHQQPFPSPSVQADLLAASPPPLTLGNRWPSSLFATPAHCTGLYNEIHKNVFYLIICLSSTLYYELFESGLTTNHLFILRV